MGCGVYPGFHLGPSNLISGGNTASAHLLAPAWDKISTAYRSSTSTAHVTHFKTYLAYITFMDLPLQINIHNILTFIEYLHSNALSHKVISNYLSSLATMAQRYNIKHGVLKPSTVTRLMRSKSKFAPTPRGIFDIKTLYLMSISCEILADPLLFRAILQPIIGF